MNDILADGRREYATPNRRAWEQFQRQKDLHDERESQVEEPLVYKGKKVTIGDEVGVVINYTHELVWIRLKDSSIAEVPHHYIKGD